MLLQRNVSASNFRPTSHSQASTEGAGNLIVPDSTFPTVRRISNGLLDAFLGRVKSSLSERREESDLSSAPSSQGSSVGKTSDDEQPEVTGLCVDRRRKDNYDRNLELRQQEQEEREKLHQEREAYREQRRLVAKLGPKEEAYRRRVQLWLQVYFTVSPLWAIKQLQKVEKSRETLAQLLVPIIKLHLHIKRKTELLRTQQSELLQTMKQPTLQMLAQREFFKCWPHDSLLKMCCKLQPAKFSAGEYIMFDGDPGDKMYFLETGKVDIIIIKAKGPSKSRAKANGVVVATLGPGAHFGEFALLNDEPRMASIQCAEDTTCWTLGKAEFREEVFTRNKMEPWSLNMFESANNRRKMNMRKLYPLTKKQLSALPEFLGWTTEQLDHISAQVQPYVACTDEIIFYEGASTDCAYFVARGSLQIWKKTTWWRTIMNKERGESRGAKDGKTWDCDLGELLSVVSAGDIFGEIGCVCIEPQPYTVKAMSNVDLWQLPRPQWKEIMLSDANHLLQAKAVINQKRAAWIDPLTPKQILECPVLKTTFGAKLSSMVTAIMELMEPHVTGDGDAITNTGLMYVVSGCLAARGQTCRITAGTWIGGEKFSDPSVPCDELKSIGKSEMWLFSHVSYRKVALSHEEEALLAGPQTVSKRNIYVSPARETSQNRSPLVSPASNLAKNLKQALNLSEESLQEQGFSRNLSRSDATPRSRVLCGSPARSAKAMADRTTDYVRCPSARGNDRPPILSRAASARDLLGTSPVSPVREGDAVKKPIFANNRTTQAIKFASGFIPPGFARDAERKREAEANRQPVKGSDNKVPAQREREFKRPLSLSSRTGSTLTKENIVQSNLSDPASILYARSANAVRSTMTRSPLHIPRTPRRRSSVESKGSSSSAGSGSSRGSLLACKPNIIGMKSRVAEVLSPPKIRSPMVSPESSSKPSSPSCPGTFQKAFERFH